MADQISIDAGQFEQLLRILHNNSGVRLVNAESGGFRVERVTIEHLKEHEQQKDKFNITALLIRECAPLFSQELEQNYPPGTEANNNFGCIYYKWNNLLFAIITIPLKDRHRAEAAAAKVGAKLVDGIPTMFGSEDPKNNIMGLPADVFPLRNENTFNLEGP